MGKEQRQYYYNIITIDKKSDNKYHIQIDTNQHYKNRDNIFITLSLLIKIQTDPKRSKPTLQIENVNFEHFFNRPLLYYPTLLKLFGSSSCPLQL